MARAVDLFVFDLAGTTVVDDDHVLRAFLRTAATAGLAPQPAALRRYMGWHKERVFATLLVEAHRAPDAAAELARRFEHEFAALVATDPLRPTPGAEAALRALDAAGVRVAFSTGFSRATADLVLGAMGWRRFPSVASDEVAHGRPAPDLIVAAMARTGVRDPARVGVAGDTPVDLEAGAAAGARLIVGVGCGTHTLDELRGFPHTHLLPDLVALPDVVLRDG